jgi:hypothetical protein
MAHTIIEEAKAEFNGFAGLSDIPEDQSTNTPVAFEGFQFDRNAQGD